MNRLLISIAVYSLLLFSCNKTTSLPGKTLSSALAGKWKYVQYYYSIGGPLIYVSTENLNQWIVFNRDGSFATNMPQFEKAIGYELIDSSKMKLTTPLQQPGYRLYYYSLDSTDNSLSLGPADIICIEGCGNKFRR